ncbi:hypothetical protein HYV88_02270 [Candidatus Woesearchaeota archaeon]|nr:hypothetical protein [Candidatus Woesearchaeota archaeon]
MKINFEINPKRWLMRVALGAALGIAGVAGYRGLDRHFAECHSKMDYTTQLINRVYSAAAGKDRILSTDEERKILDNLGFGNIVLKEGAKLSFDPIFEKDYGRGNVVTKVVTDDYVRYRDNQFIREEFGRVSNAQLEKCLKAYENQATMPAEREN